MKGDGRVEMLKAVAPFILPTLLFSQSPVPDRRVGQYISDGRTFATSSFWIEGPSGLVLIDTQFLPSRCKEAVALAEKQTGKKVKLAIVLHPNPDKFNGTGWLQRRGIRVISSKQVIDQIPAVHKLRVSWFYEDYKPDYPKKLSLPRSFGSQTQELRSSGLKLKLHVLGAGCSEAHVVVEWQGHIFVGDLVARGSHSWLEIGKTDEWLKRLEELKALKPKYVHPGRGESGGVELLEAQTTYLNQVIELVAQEKPVGEPDKARIESIKQKIMAIYPHYRFDYFLTLGLPAEWSRQAQKNR
jgi:glyoxylase-like metal-dependent hydrolase (beta-lactamase superfamily II)